jgi:transposase
MSTPYSLDLRERLVAAVEGGLSRNRAADVFDVAVSTAVNWTRRKKETGSVAPHPMGGDKRSGIVDATAAWVLNLIKKEPDLRLDDIRRRLESDCGLTVSVPTVWRFLDKHRITFKKNTARRRARSA